MDFRNRLYSPADFATILDLDHEQPPRYIEDRGYPSITNRD
jgi:hypothetical protein